MPLRVRDLEQIPFLSKRSFIHNTVNNNSCNKPLTEMLYTDFKLHNLKQRQYIPAIPTGTLCHLLTPLKLGFLKVLHSAMRCSRGTCHQPTVCRAHLDSQPNLPSSEGHCPASPRGLDVCRKITWGRTGNSVPSAQFFYKLETAL